ncbi:MAG: DUF1926 domain-containing protein [Clostridiales bacterium]|nr:DUF1926 domain-containing protein [Clostridiales bacterium]
MSDLTFLFGVHNHQPVGNFPAVFKKAFRDCYRPFVEEMATHPGIKFTLHISGPLWEYMESHEKACWDRIKEMASRRQLELLGGGFYEPVLSVIPEEDRQGQLRLMSQFLEEKFDIRPRGAWLTERVWEPQLAKTLALAGIEYTLLDEEHFHYAGVSNIYCPYMTEEEGHSLVLFPIDKKLRYLIPFRQIKDIHPYFKEIEAGSGLAILADDGEKFGLWPGTRKWVYEEGWLRTFLEYLERESIQTMTYSEYLDTRPSLSLVYIPPASYEEMMEWILEPGDYRQLRKLKKAAPQEARRLLRGGFFREFFLKYHESNHLHKRMLFVSRALCQPKPSEPEAARELYRGQCNDAYWHGVFGGLYLPHLRQAAYFHLIEAEKKANLHQGWEKTDYDLDGREEFFYRDAVFGLLAKPSFGGSLVELDFKPLSRNLSDVLSRREESYHRGREEEAGEGKSIHELAKELPPEAEALLRYDWHPRFSLLDHFLHPRTNLEDFRRITYGEQGDFVNQEYEPELKQGRLLLKRNGHVWVDGERAPILIKKEIEPRDGQINITCVVSTVSSGEIPLLFGSEWNLYLLDDEWEEKPGKLILLGGKLELEFAPAPEIWHFPLQTLSQSEEGYDIIHQGMCFLPHWHLVLGQKQNFSFSAILRAKNGI